MFPTQLAPLGSAGSLLYWPSLSEALLFSNLMALSVLTPSEPDLGTGHVFMAFTTLRTDKGITNRKHYENNTMKTIKTLNLFHIFPLPKEWPWLGLVM